MECIIIASFNCNPTAACLIVVVLFSPRDDNGIVEVFSYAAVKRPIFGSNELNRICGFPLVMKFVNLTELGNCWSQ